MTVSELQYYTQLLNNVTIEKGVGYAWIQHGCPKNMLGVLGDFLLTIDEIDTTILAAPQEDIIQLSFRTEDLTVNIGHIAQNVLSDHKIGFGGGHSHMAGGVVNKHKFIDQFKEQDLFDLFLSKIIT
jgi:nanoRNase/pAp phosphatase (c-di-AMP/oligoRNAs hydrolase)